MHYITAYYRKLLIQSAQRHEGHRQPCQTASLQEDLWALQSKTWLRENICAKPQHSAADMPGSLLNNMLLPQGSTFYQLCQVGSALARRSGRKGLSDNSISDAGLGFDARLARGPLAT